MKWLVWLVVLAGALFLVWSFAVPAYAQWRLSTAMVDSGMRVHVADCIAGRMARQLSPMQLWKLRALEGEKRTVHEWLDSAERVRDRKVILVTTTSAALCSTGLAR